MPLNPADRAALLDGLSQLVKSDQSPNRPSARALSALAGLAPQHFSMLLARLRKDEEADVLLSTVYAFADAAGVARATVLGLGHDEPRSPSLAKNLPGWAAAVKDAKARASTIPDEAFRAAGLVSLPYAPKHVDAALVLGLARTLQEAGALGPN